MLLLILIYILVIDRMIFIYVYICMLNCLNKYGYFYVNENYRIIEIIVLECLFV